MRTRRGTLGGVRWSSITVCAAAGALLLGCTSDSSSSASTSTAPAVTSSPGGADATASDSAQTLELGALTVKTTPTGFSAAAEDAERCGSSQWRLSGPVDYEQASPVPEQCFAGAHAFDTSWYSLSLPPGEYSISLDVRRGSATGTTSATFSIPGG